MRLFIAVSFPEAALRSLNERLDRLRSNLPRASWVRPDAQHVTLAFLGEQEEAAAATLAPHVAARLQQTKSFDAGLRSCGFFPNRHHARIGWCGIDPPDPFAAIAAEIRDAVRAAGVSFDEKEFRPHLTIMRIRDPWPKPALDTFEKALHDFRSARFAVDRVTLFVSRLDPKGAVHTPLRQFSLAP